MRSGTVLSPKDMVERAVASVAKPFALPSIRLCSAAAIASFPFSLPKGIECMHVRGIQSCSICPKRRATNRSKDTFSTPCLIRHSIGVTCGEWLRSIARVPVILKGVLTAKTENAPWNMALMA